ncbi:non-canonical purine NTP pyrophosphatase [Desulfofalx alkaliphila]|uniref:non-canonical purine NTP pyrophosphatase n=1 Tax=Desulfofalx alkaliphila TaxID=105483 RepID=UPI0004E22E9B|nr:non-canonical purine NTP pyrophosphatase [Desulfofalx alkaliphila]
MGYKAFYVSRPLRFVSKNKEKNYEYSKLLSPVEFTPVWFDTAEPLGDNHRDIVQAKTLHAFDEKRAPLFVDQTGLYVDAWQGLPGGLTDTFWEKLKLTGFIKLMENEKNRSAVAITTIGYCDGKKIYLFEGRLKGTIAPEPRGENGSQWDPVFIPQGHSRTFGEMSPDEKLAISMRRTAAAEFKSFLLSQGRSRS